MVVSEELFEPADEQHVCREKAKARQLRSSQWWKNILAKGRCDYCGRSVHPSELTMDHRVPLIRGGRSTRGNVVPCCKECNSGKKYLLPVEWDGSMDAIRDEQERDDSPADS